MTGPGDDTDDRAQLLIIIALLLAVLFVALALVLNGAIYTENLSTRDTSGDSSGVLTEQRVLDNQMAEMLDRTNADTETTSNTEVLDALESDLDSYRDTRASGEAQRGASYDFWLSGDTSGVRLRQTDEERDFTDAEGNWDWSLMDDVPEGGQFKMTLQEGSLYEATLDTTLAALADSAFGVEFHLEDYGGTGDGVWRVYFFEGAVTDSIYAIVEQPDQTFQDNSADAISDGFLSQACSVHGDTVTVRLQAGTYGGITCENFGFYDDLDVHDVTFTSARSDSGVDDDTARARGSYDILAGTTSINDAAFEDPGFGQPFHQAAIYELWYSTKHVSGTVPYGAMDRHVSPVSGDAAGLLYQHPEIDRFDITDESGAEPEFGIEWAVSDRDRSLERVELILVHLATDEIADRVVITDLDSRSDSGTNTLSGGILGTIDDSYRIQITVVDESGRATTDTETRTAGD